MKSKAVLNNNIVLATLKIQEEFPELMKHLDEIPNNFQSNTQKGIRIEALNDYLESLNSLLKTYRKNHKKNNGIQIT